MEKFIRNKGITLIALVVTIIVLLLLAGISISMLTGENGIITMAGNAVEETDKADVREQIQLELLEVASEGDGTYTISDIKDAVKTVVGSEEAFNEEAETVTTAKGNELSISDIIEGASDYVAPFNGTTVADAIAYGYALNENSNTELEDANGNKVVVPAGFKVTSDASLVTEGIVIEDATYTATKGSQFVWIPVGTITKSDKTEVTIELNRYTFDSTGVPTSYGRTEVISGFYVEETQAEHTSSGCGNTVAKDIEEFINSANTNGGYYIGRYEARTATARSSSADALTTLTEVGTEYVYNYVTQLQAAELCENMYDDNSNFTSDLINSYAWDTATLFLQTCGANSTYSMQTSLNTSFATTGTNNSGGSVDMQCNVYDMASNVWEWSTETDTLRTDAFRLPCVVRGGLYYSSSYCVSNRRGYLVDRSDEMAAFRPLLYLQD